MLRCLTGRRPASLLRLLCTAAMALVLAAPAASVQARERSWRGTVTHVSDGDTLWVRPASGGAPVSVRLLDIDAPETCQAGGLRAREALASRVLRQPVVVTGSRRDDYHRVLGRVALHGQDLGGWLVSSGHAWSYRYRRRASPYDELQARARQARRGLWAEAAPIEPRVFRQRHGRCERPPGRS